MSEEYNILDNNYSSGIKDTIIFITIMLILSIGFTYILAILTKLY